MRAATLATAFYTPGIPPTKPEELSRYLQEETQKIYAAILALSAGHIDKTYAAPAKPRDGDLRYADGTSWNPGSGEGIYAYYGSAWHFLG